MAAPRGDAVRPTSDRVRESLFARLGDLEGRVVADLFAGSGALGIEALSRGAAQVVFVERAPAALACLEGNLDRLGLRSRVSIQRADVARALHRLGRRGLRFQLVLMDPPYGPELATETLRRVVASGIVAVGGEVVVEASRRHPPGEVEGLARTGERVTGDTLVVHFRVPGAAGDPGPEGHGGVEDA